MIQPTAPNPLISYVDVPSVPFVHSLQGFAGESLENLTKHEVWDVIVVLCQSASLAESFSEDSIEISEIINDEDFNLYPSKLCEKCLGTLEGFPLNQVKALMSGILSVDMSHG